jgi:hypothetical protein
VIKERVPCDELLCPSFLPWLFPRLPLEQRAPRRQRLPNQLPLHRPVRSAPSAAPGRHTQVRSAWSFAAVACTWTGRGSFYEPFLQPVTTEPQFGSPGPTGLSPASHQEPTPVVRMAPPISPSTAVRATILTGRESVDTGMTAPQVPVEAGPACTSVVRSRHNTTSYREQRTTPRGSRWDPLGALSIGKWRAHAPTARGHDSPICPAQQVSSWAALVTALSE